MAFEMTEGALLGLCRERGMYAHRPELNEVLHVTDRGVLRIAGLAAFSGLRALYLEGNAVEDIEGLEGCPDLRCLYLARNAIEEVGPGLAPLARLTTLDLSSNLLEGAALAGLAGLRELRTLSLGHNRLARRADLEPLAALPVLEALDVSNNRIDDPAACALVQSLPLKWLRFLGNPVVRATAGYRKVFLAAMHATLESLDDHPAFEADKRCALAWAQGGVEAERAERQRIRDEEAARRVRQQERFQAIVEEARTKPPEPRDPMRFRAVPVGESDDELSEPDRGQDGPTPGPSPDAGGGFLEGAGQEEEAEEEEEEEEEEKSPPPPALKRPAGAEPAAEAPAGPLDALSLGEAEGARAGEPALRDGEGGGGPAETSSAASVKEAGGLATEDGSSRGPVVRPGQLSAPSTPETASAAAPARARGLPSDLQAALRSKEARFRSGVREREMEKAAAATERVMALRQSRLDEQSEKTKAERIASSRTPVIWGTGQFKHLWEAAKIIGEREEEREKAKGGAGGAAEGGGAAPAPEEEPEAGAVRPHSGTEGQHGDGDSGYSSEESVDLYERHSVTAMGQRHDPV